MDVYPHLAEEKLGFDAVREAVATRVRTSPAAERARALCPLEDPDQAEMELARAVFLQERIASGDAMPEVGFEPIGGALDRAAPVGSWLEPEDLVDIRGLIRCARRVHGYLDRLAAGHPEARGIALLFEPLPALEEAIDGLLDDGGAVREDASDTLRRLRREASRARDRIRRTLHQAMRDASAEGWVADEQPTVRGGRMVIPVRFEARRRVDGIVHDVSATGQTAFVEPAACVELNNDLRTLQAEERREIIRLLTRVTDAVREHRADIERDQEAAIGFDLLLARARLATALDAVVPERGDEGIIELARARNPELALRLGLDQVVSLDMELGRDTRLLVISGPNAGGKSVALKTLGLFAMMLASGIPVPCAEGSRFDQFGSLFVQIGDDQSVEDDLSTFSSQIGQLSTMVERADRRSLVLLDEAGSGTDPDEGSAIARAVLEYLQDRGSVIVATTHHATLKQFAHERPGAANGMMIFDQGSLTPTFRFEAGVPGASYALEIADRVGLDPEVTGRARDLLGADRASFEALVADLQQRNTDLEDRLVRADQAAREAGERRRALEDRLSRLKESTGEIRARALEEAEQILKEANAQVERAVREIREAEAQKAVTQAARERLDQAREHVETSKKRSRRKGERRKAGPVDPAVGAGPVAVGDRVVVDGQGPAAEVLEVRGDEAVVVVGSARLRVDLDRLRRVGGAPEQSVTVRRMTSTAGVWEPTGVQRRVDLRGQRVDEALQAVTRLVDEGLSAGLESVEILHGKGTGALRTAIHEYLAARTDVAGFDEAPVEQGGAGVTIVRL